MNTPDSQELLPEYEWAIEELVHFRCTACGGWWTIGDAKIDRDYFCPYCGRQLAPAEHDDFPAYPSQPPKELQL